MHEITAGEMIKWKVNNCLFIGEILYFEIAKSLPKVELSFSGMGEVIFKRLPIETYGANAVQSMTLENIDPDNVRVSLFLLFLSRLISNLFLCSRAKQKSIVSNELLLQEFSYFLLRILPFVKKLKMAMKLSWE